MRSHFLDTQEISELFHFQGAKVETKVFLHNAWVMISKD
jgi:hypothetical protein